MPKASKSLIISLISVVIGLGTIAVGLYVLSQTPAPQPVQAEPEKDPIVVVPEVDGETPTMPEGPVERGSEKWCDKMMLTNDADWADADAQLFAQKCIYE